MKKDVAGFAKAFKQDISRESELLEEGWRIESGTTVFMNPTRQDIFVKLSEKPGVGLREMARMMGVSAPTASWHLGKLSNAGILVVKKVGNSTRYFPNWMIEHDDMDFVALLATELPCNVLKIILETPGINQKEIAKKVSKPHQSIIRVCDKLAAAGVISIIEDGRYTRYFPTELLSTKDEEYTDRIKLFRENVVLALKADGVKPKIIKNMKNKFVVDVTAGSDRRRLQISCAPFRTLLG